MKRVLPWVGLGLLAAAVGSVTFACSSDSGSSGGKGGTGGGIVTGGTGGGGTGGTGGTAGTSGTGGTGGGTASKLGSTCTTDDLCGTGLKCEKVSDSDFGNGGPSQGYCTLACTSNADCQAIDAAAQCVGFGSAAFCLEGCVAAQAGAGTECHGRYDSMCLGLTQTDADGGAIEGGAPTYACIPECATDNDCGTRKCDLRSGLCSDTPNTGLPVGSSCDPTATTDPCEGFCIGFSGGDPKAGMCTAVCSNASGTANSLGIPGSCGSDPAIDQSTGFAANPQDAACLFQASTTNPDGSPGATLGICGQLCDCDKDCLQATDVCTSWADAGVSSPSQFVSIFHRAGLCLTKDNGDGGVNPGTPTCPGTGGTGGAGGAAGTGGTAGASGSAGAAGTAGTAGTGGTAGAAGTATDAGTD